MARPIKNNAEYFPHMAKMRDDQRLKSVRRQFGLEGYAVYCMLLESLTDAADFSIPVDDIALELLADDFGLELDRLRGVLECFRRLKLIEWTEKRIYCPKLVQYLDPLIEERRRKREWAEQRKQKDAPQAAENQGESEFSTSKTPNIKIKVKDKSKRTKEKGLAADAANGQNGAGKPESENEKTKRRNGSIRGKRKKETSFKGRRRSCENPGPG